MQLIICDKCGIAVEGGRYCILSSSNSGYDFSKEVCLGCMEKVEALFPQSKKRLPPKSEIVKKYF